MATLAPAAIALVRSPEYRIPPSAIIGVFVSRSRLSRLVNRRDLGHTDAGDHARGANRSGPNANFDSIATGFNQISRTLPCRHVTGDDINIPSFLRLPHRFQHVARMTVGTVHDQHVDVLADQALGTFEVEDANRRTDSQSTLLIPTCIRVPFEHVDVFDRDQSR